MDTLRELGSIVEPETVFVDPETDDIIRLGRPRRFISEGSGVEIFRMPWRLHQTTYNFIRLAEQLGFDDLANQVRIQIYLTEVRSMYMADILGALYNENQNIC